MEIEEYFELKEVEKKLRELVNKYGHAKVSRLLELVDTDTPVTEKGTVSDIPMPEKRKPKIKKVLWTEEMYREVDACKTNEQRKAFVEKYNDKAKYMRYDRKERKKIEEAKPKPKLSVEKAEHILAKATENKGKKSRLTDLQKQFLRDHTIDSFRVKYPEIKLSIIQLRKLKNALNGPYVSNSHIKWTGKMKKDLISMDIDDFIAKYEGVGITKSKAYAMKYLVHKEQDKEKPKKPTDRAMINNKADDTYMEKLRKEEEIEVKKEKCYLCGKPAIPDTDVCEECQRTVKK